MAHSRRPRLLALGRGALLLGAGTAMIYPALPAGAIADALGMAAAIWAVAAMAAVSGLVVAARMYETKPTAAPRTGPA